MQLKKSAQPKAVGAKAEAKPQFDSVPLKRVSTDLSKEDLTKKSSTIPDIEKVLARKVLFVKKL